LVGRFPILQKQINHCVFIARDIVTTCGLVHNFLTTRHPMPSKTDAPQKTSEKRGIMSFDSEEFGYARIKNNWPRKQRQRNSTSKDTDRISSLRKSITQQLLREGYQRYSEDS